MDRCSERTFRVKGISDKDSIGIISDCVQWRCFVCEGRSVNANISLADK